MFLFSECLISLQGETVEQHSVTAYEQELASAGIFSKHPSLFTISRLMKKLAGGIDQSLFSL